MHANGIVAVAAVIAWSGSAIGAPTLDGAIGPGDGYVLLTEAGASQPVFGGSGSASDSVAESSAFNAWDGFLNNNISMSDNRGDLINFYISADANNLYIAVAGPTGMFNNWFESDSRASNDIADVFVAIDTAGTGPSGSLNAASGHKGFGGAKAVDFRGWTPSHVLGVQYANNGGGGTGWANLEITGGTLNQIAAEGQSLGNGGFDWAAGFNGAAGYDTHNGSAGELEFAIPWTALGFASMPLGQDLRFAGFTTHNYANSDAYDSFPGVGNNGPFEQIGDNPGDPDWDGSNFLWGSSDPGSFGGSQPGADFVGEPLNGTPGPYDGIDTIEQYFVWNVVPTPGSGIVLFGAAALGLHRRRR